MRNKSPAKSAASSPPVPARISRISGRVRDESVEAVDLRDDAAIVLHRLDDGSEFGEFARELNVGIGRHRACKLTFDRLMPGKQCVEFLLRKHDSAQS